MTNPKRMGLLICGPLLATLIYSLVPESVIQADGTELTLGFAGRFTAGMVGWMALWWITETIPLFVTALLPMLLMPLVGIQSIQDTTSLYGHRIVYLALGGFILAASIEKWNLHRRFARFVIGIFGNEPRSLIGGFMVSSALLSMWISNVATAIIMMPVAISIIKLVDKSNPHYHRFAVCLLLSICYSCSIGGMGTLIGTGTNMFFAGYMGDALNRPISFFEWMVIAVPLIVVFLPIAWLLLTRLIFKIPAAKDGLVLETEKVFSHSQWQLGEKLTLAVFSVTAILWSTLPLIRAIPGFEEFTDTSVAIMAIFALFIIPAGSSSNTPFLMDWETAHKKVPWGILLLIGGGLCMAKAVSSYGVGELLAYQFCATEHIPVFVIVIVVIALMVFLTEISSNIASVTALTPIFAAIATARGMPAEQLIIPITLAASCAFMLPAASLTNSVIMGSGMIRGWEMARAGFVLNVAAIVILALRFGW